MKISHITIRNILGIKALDLTPEGFTEISGPNGAGKTSVLEAIKSVLTTGHDATLLRKGAEKGEVVLVLDDGTELSKSITEATSATTVRRDGKKIPRPAETIKALTDALSVNPVDFLLAPKKERARVLLESMPLEADVDYLSQIAGYQVKAAPGLHALHVINQVHQTVYDERTGTNRAVKEKQATIKQLEAAVPPAPAGVGGDEADLERGILDAQSARDTMLSRITAKLDGLKAAAQTDIDAARAEAQRKIDEIRAACQETVDNINAGLSVMEKRAIEARENAMATCADAVAPLNAQLQIIRNDREAAGRRKQTLETIGNLATELESLQAEAKRQTEALAAIDQYKSDLLADLPITGMELRDGDVFIDGVPLDRLNTARQVEIAVEVAKLRAADLGLICVDRIEVLDGETLSAFKRSALDSGLQFFVTKVADTPMTIETTNR